MTDTDIELLAASPITIGELTDVPAPNSPINAGYHQEIANRVVHRFANVGLMNAWAAADGSLAFVSPTLYRRVGAAWVALVDVTQLTTTNNRVTAVEKQLTTGIVAGLVNVNTDGNGDARVNFPKAFTATPSVVISVAGANSGIASVWAVVHSQDPTGFSVRAFFGTAHAPWSGLLALGYHAAGTVA